MSAFGESGGGRSIWEEDSWRVAVFQHQKSPLTSKYIYSPFNPTDLVRYLYF